MDRNEFEALRDIPDKYIEVDIRLARRGVTAPALTAEGIPIHNSAMVALRLNITYNPETNSKTFNVCVVGLGPICRLDVDGTVHGAAGRSHKHSLQTPRCPGRNLKDGVQARSDLSGKPLLELWQHFCQLANIEHRGIFDI